MLDKKTTLTSPAPRATNPYHVALSKRIKKRIPSSLNGNALREIYRTLLTVTGSIQCHF